jgi:hypothetical protein
MVEMKISQQPGLTNNTPLMVGGIVLAAFAILLAIALAFRGNVHF